MENQAGLGTASRNQMLEIRNTMHGHIAARDKASQSCSRSVALALIGHLDRSGIRFRKELGAPSFAEGPQIIDPA